MKHAEGAKKKKEVFEYMLNMKDVSNCSAEVSIGTVDVVN